MAFTPTGVQFTAKGFNKYLNQLGKADKAQLGLSKSAGNIGSSFSSLGSSVLGFGGTLAKVAAGGVAAMVAGLVGLGAVSINTAISFESAFAGVEKTVDGLDKVVTGTSITLGEKLKGSLVEISKAAPVTFEELARIGELGGQLGIQYSETDDSLVKFTETIAQLGVATSLSEEEAATSLARISNIYQKTGDEAGENIERLGSTIVALGNHFATTEPEIVTFATRIAGAGQIAGLSQAEILAIGTAFSSVGVQAEAGGTSVQKVLLAMNGAVNATSEGFVDNSEKIDANVKSLTKLQAESARLEAQFPGLQAEIVAQRDAFIAAGGTAEDFGRQLGDKTRQKAFETATAIQELSTETQLLRDQQGQPVDPGQLTKFAQVAGLSADEFAEAWNKDAAGAFQLFVEGLGREGDNAESVLRDLNLTDQRLIRSFLSLAGAGDLLSETLELGSKAWEENNALQIEADKRFATTESRIQIFKNTLRAFANDTGRRLLPIVNRLIDTGIEFVEKWAEPIESAVGRVLGAFDRFGIRGATVSLLGLLGLDPTQISEVLSVVDGIVIGITEAFGRISEAFDRFGARGAAISILGLLGLEPDTIATVLSVVDTIIATVTELATQIVNVVSQISFDEILGALTGIGAVIVGGILAALVAGLFSLLTPINLIIAAAALLGAAWAGNWGNIQGITMSVIQTITDLFSTAFPIIQAVVLTTATVISAVFSSIAAIFTGSILPSLQSAFDNITIALASLGISWSDVWNAILAAVGIVAAAIGAILLALVATVVSIISAMAAAIEVGSQAFVNLVMFIEQAITGITQILVGFGLVFSGIFTDSATVVEGFKLIWVGLGNFLEGIFGGIITIIAGGLTAIITAIGEFGSSIVEFFTSLSDTLVGNSIIPDMIQAIIDLFTGMAEPILSVFSTLSESIGSVLGAIFGGGEEGEAPTFAFDPEEALIGIEQVNMAIATLTTAISNIFTVTLPVLVTSVVTTVEAIIPLWQQVILTIMQLNMLVVELYSVHLPTLQAVSEITTQLMVTGFTLVNTTVMQLISTIIQLYSVHLPTLSTVTAVTTAAMVAGFTQVNAVLSETINLVNQLSEAIKKLGEEAGKAANKFKSLAQKINSDLVNALNNARSAAEDLRSALEGAISAAGGLGNALEAGAGIGTGARRGLGLKAGIGFQAGTLGFTVPAGFPNDSFLIGLTSQEEALVAPASSSIDKIVMDAFGVGGKSVQVDINIGSVNTPMDLAIVTEQIRRVIAEDTN